jgi:hypothetical protein
VEFVTLYYAYDSHKGWAALKQIGFPTRIVAIIKTDDFLTVEEIVAELLLELWYAEFCRIEIIADYNNAQKVDLDLAENIFLEKRAKNRNK